VSEIEQPEVPSKDECVIAMLAHVLMIFSWFWAPLIIYFAKRDSRFVAFHVLQALCWQVILFCGWVLSFIAFIVVATTVGFASVGAHRPSLTPAAFLLLFWLVFMGGWALNMVLGVLFGIKGSHGEWARYPVLGRWALRHAKARTA
jgi:uncharacterized Tic20 family protein